ncbi:glycosyltransferase family 22 protein [Ophiostoma piceae UAMH 11346]|uniref:Mannosyltransferase n=1 Tax=Ophiostoma piceae (strain UAMH 11346) TaxID=1262450 RepID=S3C213_OPHP1|nr:glycosyltransferase family 22 protein [Ophiostoma piceae UAMH 11346]
MKLLDLLLAAALATLVVVHLVAAPYTKVEESFNIQAAHDILVYGTPTGPGAFARLAERYDHAVFSGAVPRSFVGAVVLAGLAQPLLQLLAILPLPAATTVDGSVAQLVVRGILGLGNGAAMLVLSRALAASCGRAAARWYVVLQAAQFHVLFYASRTLPNMFAFFLTTLAFAFLLTPPPGTAAAARTAASGRVRVALCLLAFAGVVFRGEVALLLVTTSAYLVVAPLASAERIVRAVALAVAVALLLSVPIDSYFWQTLPRPFWPELHGFLFNVVDGQASAWGTSPWHYYFTSALPRLLLNPASFVLIPFALTRLPTRGPAALLTVPALAFIAVYSLQPHKEARFILYVVPPLTATAALGASQLQTLARKSAPAKLALAGVAGLTLLSLAAATGMLLLSSLNYPGGEALAALRALVAADPGAASAVVAHADVLACMTGVTLFGSTLGAALPSHQVAVERRTAAAAITGAQRTQETEISFDSAATTTHLVVDKTEDARLLDPSFWTQFDYLLMEDPSKAVGGAWTTVAVVQGYAGIEVLRPGQSVDDETATAATSAPVVGHGRLVSRVREAVRARTGGWWVGPRMAPRIHLLQRVKGSSTSGATAGKVGKSGNKVVTAQRVSS